MPLMQSKSPKVVGENIEAEMSAGKPHDQAIAIALDVQRRNRMKKMAMGGMVTSEDADRMAEDDAKSLAQSVMQHHMGPQMESDQDVDTEMPHDEFEDEGAALSEDAHNESIIDSIMAKHRKKSLFG